MKTPPLDLKDTAALKGLAISAIVLHNHYHLLGPVKQIENEFDYSASHFATFLWCLQDPHHVVQALFAFFGHYGVQVFIFLSAYGLTVSHWQTKETWQAFLWSRVKKIYPMFAIAICGWLLFMPAFWHNPIATIRGQSESIILTLLGVQNLLPGFNLTMIGPWWFVPFIMQLYAMWSGLRWVAKRYGNCGLAILSCSSVALLYLTAGSSVHLLETPIGHLPEICLGIFAARSGKLPGAIPGMIGGLVLLLGNVYRVLWPLSFIGSLLLVLWMYQSAAPLVGRSLFTEIGTYSMSVFLVNGFVRMPFLQFAKLAESDKWVEELLLGLASAMFAIMFGMMVFHFEKAIADKFERLRNCSYDRPLSSVPHIDRTALRATKMIQPQAVKNLSAGPIFRIFEV